jgi:hypothetical protein
LEVQHPLGGKGKARVMEVSLDGKSVGFFDIFADSKFTQSFGKQFVMLLAACKFVQLLGGITGAFLEPSRSGQRPIRFARPASKSAADQ